jgi:uncharacterized protein (TIGR03083 family)
MTRTSVEEAELRDMIAAERWELAEILNAATIHSWDARSLCAGWRVREVVAHMTMPFRYSTPRVAFEVMRSGGSFARMSDRFARMDAGIPTDELVTTLRGNADNPWKPPGGGFEGALTHDVIHGLDITVPLGVARKAPEGRLRLVLDVVARPKSVRYFGTDLNGIELRADDIDWSLGSGTPVFGLAQNLALVLSGRKLPAELLRGEASKRFVTA